MTMEPITRTRYEQIAANGGLHPGRVKGTDLVQFYKGMNNPRFDDISWDEFAETLERRGLSVFATGKWLKIMKKREQ